MPYNTEVNFNVSYFQIYSKNESRMLLSKPTENNLANTRDNLEHLLNSNTQLTVLQYNDNIFSIKLIVYSLNLD